jgi:hypothetical protein
VGERNLHHAKTHLEAGRAAQRRPTNVPFPKK